MHGPPASVEVQMCVSRMKLCEIPQTKFEFTLSTANCSCSVGMFSLSRFPVLPHPAVVAIQLLNEFPTSDHLGSSTGRTRSLISASRFMVRIAMSSRFSRELYLGCDRMFETPISCSMLAMLDAPSAIVRVTWLEMWRIRNDLLHCCITREHTRKCKPLPLGHVLARSKCHCRIHVQNHHG